MTLVMAASTLVPIKPLDGAALKSRGLLAGAGLLSALLLLFGCVSLGRAFLLPGGGVSPPAWRVAAIILGSIAAFTLLLEPAGMIAALSALILGGATASTRFRPGAKPLLGAAALIVACALVFVHWLRLPMPLLGPWLGG